MSALLSQGVHDPAVWGRALLAPRWLGAAIDNLPRLTLDRIITSPFIPLHNPGAVGVCLSSQVGCAMACACCSTARMAN